ncbi:cell wall hydrolase [Metapseudomonas lalkuanensis]|uniref:cell wall hydrolase n=1 Tax=Metapseudomonas lalkuanensis TaxID=2604832 RepID=UPI001CF58EC3|nr:cell wall hydrolase [Pseudomonas lalkuanensis]UCP00112.1 cell wall hydrolase [Pseudomonas lalkuanensis]
MSQRERDIDVLARTIWGEARGEGIAGQVAVGWTIRNRVEMDLGNDGKPDWWGEGYEGVCRAPWQFSCWNKNDPNYPYLSGARAIPNTQYMLAREAAVAVIEGRQPDPTSGATHYYATTMPKAPKWVAGAARTCKIGRHIFFKDVP